MKFTFSAIFAAFGHFFTGFFKGVFTPEVASTLETAVVAFIKTDVGALALDAVQYSSTLPGGNDAQRAAATAKLKADLKSAGKDVEKLGESALNLFVELAYNYAKGALTAAVAGAALAA